MQIEIIHTSKPETARELAGRGYEPIECAFGAVGGSVLGPLAMDHHGAESHREGVAIRAYRDHFGSRVADPRFVVTGDCDADATFAIASLCGLLPHPSRKVALDGKPGWLVAALTRDVTALAELVNLRDTDPFKIKLPEHLWGPTVLLWQQLATGEEDATGFHAGVDRWRKLTGPSAPKSLLEAAIAEEAQRIKTARAARTEKISAHVGLVEGEVFGFDVWYTEDPGTPVVLAYNPFQEQVTIGCRDLEAAERLFGKGGLKNVFAQLSPKANGGWGGRETVGGSPRGLRLNRDETRIAAGLVAALVKTPAKV